ncbi:NAD(P)/FAD-dependent oxidoreductase [Nakamurella leprariae]|uniref:FAD-dependent oxidoreductase n=1 Tax=Nakamurella leprariae TaxID=2803911 RepID=A0A939C076_9ACTN|nr:FAD-dependent oxidoreductase [Nakamurella leprariae]MBM9465714.1 FAD-dependent oxidoreductase [Nakamurella leprariae]
MSGVVIVGACQAGMQTAASLREHGYSEAITLIGEEQHLPYQRPPLSKGFVTGRTTVDQLALRVESFYTERDIEVITGDRIVEIDRSARSAVGHLGRRYPFEHLVLTTGSHPRPFPGPGARLRNVLTLRSVEDAVAIATSFNGVEDVVVLGGGFIGLELAATAAALGKTVTLVEATAGLMGRAVSPRVADFFLRQHRARGVDVRLNSSVSEIIEGTPGEAGGVLLTTGESIPASLIVVGIGAVPTTDLGVDLGLGMGLGILVDEFAQTTQPNVLAAGDCAQHRDLAGHSRVLTSVQNAIDQATVAARTITGDLSRPYDAVPWFWSDQYDLKLQMAGLAQDHDEVVLRGDPEAGGFSLLYLRDGRLVWAESVSKPGEHVVARRLISAGSAVDPNLLADTTVRMQDAVIENSEMASTVE